MKYDLNDIATMTGLTDRTLRTYLKLGILDGEKVDGVWTFTEEDVSAFMEKSEVRQSISAKENAVVFDFMADKYKKANRALVILDCPVEKEKAMEISAFFCKAICDEGKDIQFKFKYDKGLGRFILSGAEDMVAEIMKKYYER